MSRERQTNSSTSFGKESNSFQQRPWQSSAACSQVRKPPSITNISLLRSILTTATAGTVDVPNTKNHDQAVSFTPEGSPSPEAGNTSSDQSMCLTTVSKANDEKVASILKNLAKMTKNNAANAANAAAVRSAPATPLHSVPQSLPWTVPTDQNNGVSSTVVTAPFRDLQHVTKSSFASSPSFASSDAGLFSVRDHNGQGNTSLSGTALPVPAPTALSGYSQKQMVVYNALLDAGYSENDIPELIAAVLPTAPAHSQSMPIVSAPPQYGVAGQQQLPPAWSQGHAQLSHDGPNDDFEDIERVMHRTVASSRARGRSRSPDRGRRRDSTVEQGRMSSSSHIGSGPSFGQDEGRSRRDYRERSPLRRKSPLASVESHDGLPTAPKFYRIGETVEEGNIKGGKSRTFRPWTRLLIQP